MIKRHHILLYFIGLLVLMHVLNYLILLSLEHFNFLTYNQTNLILLICVPLTYILVIFATTKFFKINFQLKFEQCNSKILLSAIFLVLFLYVFQTAVDKPFINSLAQGELRFLKIRAPFQGNLYTKIFTALSVFVGPLLEEILYRRLIFRKLLENYSLSASIIITSLLFAIMHLSLEGFLAYFLVGLVYTYLYHLTRTLWLNILIHGLYNLFVSVTAITTYRPPDSFYFIGLFIYVICAMGIMVTLKRIKVLTD